MWSVFILGIIITFISGSQTGQYTFVGGYGTSLILFMFIAPFIKRARDKKAWEAEADYLAKKIAEELQSANEGQN